MVADAAGVSCNQHWVDIYNYRGVDTLDSWFPGITRRIKQVTARAQ